jgi:hypothetical protein
MTGRAASQVAYLAGLANRAASAPPPLRLQPRQAPQSLQPPRPLFAGPGYGLDSPQDAGLDRALGLGLDPAPSPGDDLRDQDGLAGTSGSETAEAASVSSQVPAPAPPARPAPAENLVPTKKPAGPEPRSAGTSASGTGPSWPGSPPSATPRTRAPGTGAAGQASSRGAEAAGRAEATGPGPVARPLARDWLWGAPVELPAAHREHGPTVPGPAQAGETVRDLLPPVGTEHAGPDRSRREPPGRVTIGTIEVTVLPPARPAHGAGIPPQMAPSAGKPLTAAHPAPPRFAEAGTARLRDGLRRWYGIAQG